MTQIKVQPARPGEEKRQHQSITFSCEPGAAASRPPAAAPGEGATLRRPRRRMAEATYGGGAGPSPRRRAAEPVPEAEARRGDGRGSSVSAGGCGGLVERKQQHIGVEVDNSCIFFRLAFPPPANRSVWLLPCLAGKARSRAPCRGGASNGGTPRRRRRGAGSTGGAAAV